jgi:hypothetical protein
MNFVSIVLLSLIEFIGNKMNITLIFDFSHQFSAILVVDEDVFLLHRELSLWLFEEIEYSSVLKVDEDIPK